MIIIIITPLVTSKYFYTFTCIYTVTLFNNCCTLLDNGTNGDNTNVGAIVGGVVGGVVAMITVCVVVVLIYCCCKCYKNQVLYNYYVAM